MENVDISIFVSDSNLSANYAQDNTMASNQVARCTDKAEGSGHPIFSDPVTWKYIYRSL